MTHEEIRAILADLAGAQLALRNSSDAFDQAMIHLDDTMAGLRAMIASIGTANTAQRQVLDAVIAATNKALAAFDGRQQ